MTDTSKPSLDVALRRLDVEIQSGHCGEGNIERMARNHHNDAVDVVMDFIARATDEEGLARAMWWGWVQEHSGWSLENWPDDVNSSVAEQFRKRARAIIAHIKGEKKDG